MRRVLILLAALFALAPAGALAARPQTSLPDIEDEVMCPVCGVPLNIAESPQANDEKRFIQNLIDKGESKQQIKDTLVDEYGRNVLALPKASGFDLTAYIVPIALVAALLVALAFGLPRWRRRARVAAAAAPTGGPALSASDRARLDEDLARYEP